MPEKCSISRMKKASMRGSLRCRGQGSRLEFMALAVVSQLICRHSKCQVLNNTINKRIWSNSKNQLSPTKTHLLVQNVVVSD